MDFDIYLQIYTYLQVVESHKFNYMCTEDLPQLQKHIRYKDI